MRIFFLFVLMTLSLAAGSAAAAQAAFPPLNPAQKACAIRILGKKTFVRLAAQRGAIPAAVRKRVAHCLPRQRPQPRTPAVPTCTGSFGLPVDLALVTSVGAPGQVRGGDYKGHGYFRLTSNDAAVVLPVAATLYEGGRYLEMGEVQYLLYFRTACGRVVLFDHVLQPSAAILAAFAGKPEAKPDDSGTYPLPATALAAGSRVADAVGFRNIASAGFDFGVYDLAKPNAASQRAGFAGNTATWRDANALCWYDMFASGDAARIRSLVGLDSVEGATSDVCS